MKYMTINGKRFQIVNSWTKEGERITRDLDYCKDWTDLYTKPSTTKEEIKDSWEKWASDTTEYHVIILGYLGGVQTFSIYGTIDQDPFKITPTRNIIVI